MVITIVFVQSSDDFLIQVVTHLEQAGFEVPDGFGRSTWFSCEALHGRRCTEWLKDSARRVTSLGAASVQWPAKWKFSGTWTKKMKDALRIASKFGMSSLIS